VKQAIAEREERERKEAEERAARRVSFPQVAPFLIFPQAQGLDLDEADEDPRARRERERQAELEADMQMAQELFAATSVKTNGESENDISNFRPRTKDEFDDFAKRLTAVITSVSNLPHYAMFIAGLVKSIAEPLGSEDVKKVTSGLTALGNEKLKAEKGSGGKKKAAKKPVLSVGAAKTLAPKFDTRDYGADDDFDDDFMVSSRIPVLC